MVFILAWLYQSYRFCTSPRFIILSFSLTTITVSNVVCIVLFELVSIDVLLLNEFLLPKSKRLFHSQTNTFQKQTHLKPSIMLQMVVFLQVSEQTFDARWKTLSLMVV